MVRGGGLVVNETTGRMLTLYLMIRYVRQVGTDTLSHRHEGSVHILL